jgi:hypothetical protein
VFAVVQLTPSSSRDRWSIACTQKIVSST